jgi:segregation and condensation protein A
MRRLLAAMLQGAALEAFLPTGGGQRPTARLQRRAALASTLVAGLELSRNGAALLDQDAGFGGIVVRPGDAGGALASRDAAARPKQRPRCNRGRFPGEAVAPAGMA